MKDLGLDYNVFELISKGLSVNNIRLNKPVLYLRREGDTWSISRLIKKQAQEADRQGPPSRSRSTTSASATARSWSTARSARPGVEVPKRFDHLDAKLSFKYEPVRYSIEITHVSFRGSEPAIALNALSGGVSVKDDTLFVDKLALRTAETSLSIDGAVQHYLTKPVFNLQISSDKLSLPEIARLVPALAGIRLQPAFELKLDGPADRLGIDMNVRSSAGDVTGTLVADVSAPGQSVNGTLSVRHLDLAPILNNPRQKSDITADAHVDLHGAARSPISTRCAAGVTARPRRVSSPPVTRPTQVKVDAPDRRAPGRSTARAPAYGATATTAGRVTLPTGQERPFARVRSARPGAARRSPAAAARAEGAAGRDQRQRRLSRRRHRAVGADRAISRFQPSTVAGARIAGGSTAGVSASRAEHRLSRRRDRRRASISSASAASSRCRRWPNDRYKSAINGHIVANGSGTTPEEMDVTASGTLTDSSILGGRIPARWPSTRRSRTTPRT